MSLLTEQMVDCIIMDKHTSPDGYGGVTTEWVDGSPIQAAITYDNSLQAQMAEKQGVTGLYTITTTKSIVLRFHDIIKRKSDNALFRVTSNGDDNKTPKSAGLNMRQVNAEIMETIK